VEKTYLYRFCRGQMKEIIVQQLMSVEVSSLPPEASLQQAVKLMVDKRYSCIIIKKDNFPVGIMTERDLVKVLNQESQSIDLSLPISELMSSPISTLNQTDTLFDAMVISRAEKIRHLPVIDNDERLVGLVTHTDLANAHFRVIELQTQMIENAVAAKTSELSVLNDELQTLSTEDHLMKIGNRRSMEVDLGRTHTSSVRYEHPYSVLLMDIDFFKLYNDHYGHLAGDEALKSVANVLKENIRGSDRLYRYGGEELLLVLPNTNVTQAEKVARKLLSSLTKCAIPHEKSTHKVLTASCGGACVLSGGEMAGTWEDLVEVADSNLYKAKNSGRNCSVVS